MSVDAFLHSRLRNCLQTVLELNDGSNSPVLAYAFRQELELIRKFLLQLDAVELREEDVLRIEKATEVFLNELRGLFAAAPSDSADPAARAAAADTPTRLQ
jgi:hypothetical protein